MTVTVEQLTEFIESRFQIGESTNTWQSVTGEPYVRIGHSVAIPTIRGVVDEGEAEELGFDEETACMAARSAFEMYAEDHHGTLYWRIRPQLEWDKHHRRCRVYTRLLISDKPRIS